MKQFSDEQLENLDTNIRAMHNEGKALRAQVAALEPLAQQLYDLTTTLFSVMPTAVIEHGASQRYHDAVAALVELRRQMRDARLVTHDESKWLRRTV